MPPLTQNQNNAIQNVGVTTGQLENPTPIPNLPTSQSNFDIEQYLTPSPIQQQDLQTAQQTRDTSFEDLTSAMFGTETQGARTLQAEQQAGIPQLQTELTDITNQIMKTDLDFRRQREEIMNRPGLTMGQAQAELAQAQRRQASQLADLEIIRSARSNTLSNAQSIVQRKTELQFADEQARIDRLKFIYENNEGRYKDALGKVLKKEERAFELAKDKYQETQKVITELTYNAAQRGASNATLLAIQKSKDIGEAYKNAGSMAISIDTLIKNKQLDKLSAEIKALEEPLEIPTVAGSPNNLITKMLNSSVNKSDLSQSEREQLNKMNLVISQLGTLQQSIQASNKTGIIKGRVNNLLANLGANATAGEINAQIQALIPNVARGIYGEVGVLTDADIENYRKTLPNLKTISEQNDLVLAMTLRNAMKSYENILKGAVNSNINVSGWAQDYADIKEQVFSIEDKIGISKAKVENFVSKNPQTKEMVSELIRAGASDREILQILGTE